MRRRNRKARSATSKILMRASLQDEAWSKFRRVGQTATKIFMFLLVCLCIAYIFQLWNPPRVQINDDGGDEDGFGKRVQQISLNPSEHGRWVQTPVVHTKKNTSRQRQDVQPFAGFGQTPPPVAESTNWSPNVYTNTTQSETGTVPPYPSYPNESMPGDDSIVSEPAAPAIELTVASASKVDTSQQLPTNMDEQPIEESSSMPESDEKGTDEFASGDNSIVSEPVAPAASHTEAETPMDTQQISGETQAASKVDPPHRRTQNKDIQKQGKGTSRKLKQTKESSAMPESDEKGADAFMSGGDSIVSEPAAPAASHTEAETPMDTQQISGETQAASKVDPPHRRTQNKDIQKQGKGTSRKLKQTKPIKESNKSDEKGADELMPGDDSIVSEPAAPAASHTEAETPMDAQEMSGETPAASQVDNPQVEMADSDGTGIENSTDDPMGAVPPTVQAQLNQRKRLGELQLHPKQIKFGKTGAMVSVRTKLDSK